MPAEPLKSARDNESWMPKSPYWGRVAAISEVVLVLVAAHVAFRTFKHFTAWGRWETAVGLNYSAGCVLILVSVGVLLLCGRDFATYGLTLKDWRRNLSAGLFCGLLMMAAVVLAGLLAIILTMVLQISGAVATALAGPPIYLAATVLMLVILQCDEHAVYRCPATVTLLLLVGLLLLPLVKASNADGAPLLPVAGALAWFAGSGFGEEIFFRGYMQSRLNGSFGRPFRLLGVEFGFGVLVSSLLFGLMHALNTVDYFEGRFEFAWQLGVASVFAGIFFGLLREKTESIVAGGVAHGFTDVTAHVFRVIAAGR
jgi:hypothetical protein